MTYEHSEIQKFSEEDCSYKIDASQLLNAYECPFCKKKNPIKVDFSTLEKLYGKIEGIIPHIVLHGEPLHGILCYVDKHMAVRGKEHIVSIAISRDSITFQQLVKSWLQSTTKIL